MTTRLPIESPNDSNQLLSPRQLAALAAVVDGLLPPIPAPPSSTSRNQNDDDADVNRYWEHRLSEDPHFMRALQDTLQYKLRTKQEQNLLLLLLYLLSTRFGTLLLLGPFYFIHHPFVAYCDLTTVSEKTRALQHHLQQSIFSPKRRIFNAFKRLVFGLAFSYVAPSESDKDATKFTKESEDREPSVAATNPFWKAMSYRGPPQQWTGQRTNTQEALDDSKRVEHAMKRLEALNKHMVDVTDSLGLSTPGDGGNPQCKELECDVVIVGSGCGGSVAAFELAKAGYEVIVVEQGQYIPPSNLSNLEVDALDQMYDSHSLLTTEDGNIVILAGATLGGGSSVNWSCCLPLPPHVKQEWTTDHGLEQFKNGGSFDASMKHMMSLMTNDNTASVKHNAMNKLLQKGCDAMGYQWETARQNLENTEDPAAGYIGFGDRYGNKRSATSTFLNPAVGQYNARVLEQCYVEKVLTRRVASKDPKSTRSLQAVGVRCRMRSAALDTHIEIKCRKGVVVAAGSLHSPCLLLRSGLQNRHIGRNLRLHPVTLALGRFECPVDFYLGAPMTTVCNEFQMGPLNDGYGCKIESPSAHTGLTAVAIPFTSTGQIKERMSCFSHSVPLIVLQRDGGIGGRVRCHPENGRPMIDYAVNAHDRRSMLEGVKGVVKILAKAGALEIGTCHYKDFGWNAPHDTENEEGSPPLPEYLDSISRRGIELHDFGVFSAHQMGTCRMSVNPSRGVVDQNGETWDCEDLYVMDASTFPTASGANPMMTVLSISHMLSTRLASKFGSAMTPQSNSNGNHYKSE